MSFIFVCTTFDEEIISYLLATQNRMTFADILDISNHLIEVLMMTASITYYDNVCAIPVIPIRSSYGYQVRSFSLIIITRL